MSTFRLVSDHLRVRVGGHHVVTGRLVFTYGDPWPEGVLTGYEDAGGFVIEHVITFRRGVLVAMLVEGLRIAGERGYHHLRCRLPQDFPKTPRLRSLAIRMGFTIYHEDTQWLDLVWYP